VGLTKFLPGAEKGEPDKFYPSGARSFARVVPADDVQASAAAGWTRSLGARRVFLLGDKSLEGDGLVELYRAVAPEVGLEIVGADRMDPRSEEYEDLARDVARTRPDAIYFGGAEASNALRLWRDLDAAVPEALLIGSHNLLVPAFYERLGSAESRTYITSAAQHTSQLPPSGRRLRLRRDVAGARRARSRR
jgi:branched-chain amino acid transport system substrate-binding protein